VPGVGDAVDPAAHDVLVVGLAERAGGVENPQTHVGAAVFEREEPAVARHEHALASVVGRPQLQMRLEIVVAFGGVVVGPHGHAHDPVFAFMPPDGGGEAR